MVTLDHVPCQTLTSQEASQGTRSLLFMILFQILVLAGMRWRTVAVVMVNVSM